MPFQDEYIQPPEPSPRRLSAQIQDIYRKMDAINKRTEPKHKSSKKNTKPIITTKTDFQYLDPTQQLIDDLRNSLILIIKGVFATTIIFAIIVVVTSLLRLLCSNC